MVPHLAYHHIVYQYPPPFHKKLKMSKKFFENEISVKIYLTLRRISTKAKTRVIIERSADDKHSFLANMVRRAAIST